MLVYLNLSPTADVNANRAVKAAKNSVATHKRALNSVCMRFFVYMCIYV